MSNKEADNLEAGNSLGHYRILKKIGAGGMGEVFLAEDSRLRRKIALKVLPENIAADRDRLRRFEQEAFAASALNHPNILTIYEFGVEGETYFLAAEFVAGETLRERMGREPLTLSEALDIGVQTVSALRAAHEAGIVHRDIKPENIMLRKADGLLKVLDFGLAKLTERKIEPVDSEDATRTLVMTAPGMVMGTAGYMSPEQARGKEVDARTDIFSFGVVLYEMLSGKKPFEGENAMDVISSILKNEPIPLSRLKPDAPHDLERIINKSLRKDREERYQTAKDLLIDLKDVRQELEFQNKLERTAPPNREEAKTQAFSTTTKDAAPDTTSSAEYVVNEIRQHKSGFLAVLSILVLAAIGLGYWFYTNRSAQSDARQIESIAVMPFVNEGGNANTEYLSDGMTESLITSLSKLPKLSVKARSSVFRYKGKEIEPRKVGADLSVQAVLLGRVVQRDNDLTLNIELVDAQTENVLWKADYNRSMTNLVSLQSEIARDVSQKLHARISNADAEKITKSYTENAESYQFYLKGRFYWNKRTSENLKKAIEQFKAATEADRHYALAYVGLADCYALLEEYLGSPTSENLPLAKSYAERALQIDDSLGEAHISLANINSKVWQWEEADKEFQRGIEINPNYATGYAWLCLHLRALGRTDESLDAIKKAQQLDPLSLIINQNAAVVYLWKGNAESAAEQSRKLIELDANYALGHSLLGLAYLKQGLKNESLEELQKAVVLSNRASRNLGYIGFSYGYFGKRNEALSVLKELKEKYAKRQARGLDIAMVLTGLGEKDETFYWLERDFQTRSGTLAFSRWEVPFESIRGDPRYIDLLQRMGLKP